MSELEVDGLRYRAIEGVGDRVEERIIEREHEIADLKRLVTDRRDGGPTSGKWSLCR